MTLQVVIDSREQMPLDFGPEVPTVRRKLDAGDYSAAGFEHRLAVERKSLSDLLGSLTRDRPPVLRGTWTPGRPGAPGRGCGSRA